MADGVSVLQGKAPATAKAAAPPRLYVLAVFSSAALVFLVEPMIARMVLPRLGGSSAVWNTSLAFFQAALLAGYAYAHALQRLKSVKAQMATHLAILVLAAIGVPLGWCVLHTIMAFHYAALHYFDDPQTKGREKDLKFPGGGNPGVWDFLYFSFVVGMTAQVSDVGVTTTAMRRAVMLHGMVSFFFNTVFIALAVNAAVAMAS